MFKLFILKTRRFFRVAFRGLGFKLSIVFLLFSVAVSLMIIAPNCFDRVPVYSYFIKELNLPITYQLTGKVEIIDVDGNVANTDVEIFVGGYSTHTDSKGQYTLNFSSPITLEVYVIIRYANPEGITITKTETIQINSGNHKIEGEFTYNA